MHAGIDSLVRRASKLNPFLAQRRCILSHTPEDFRRWHAANLFLDRTDSLIASFYCSLSRACLSNLACVLRVGGGGRKEMSTGAALKQTNKPGSSKSHTEVGASAEQFNQPIDTPYRNLGHSSHPDAGIGVRETLKYGP